VTRDIKKRKISRLKTTIMRIGFLSEWMYDTPIKKREKKYFDYFKNMF
jgi:hypothetical protein